MGVGPQAPQPIALAAEVGSEVAGVSVYLGVDQEESLGFEGHDVTMPALATDLSSPLLLPTPLATDGTKMTQSEESAARRTALGRQPSITDVALTALLPTPKASDGTNGGPGMRNGRGQVDALPAAAALLPTPKSATSRSSRRAMVEVDQWSAPSLEQAVEIAQGILPREFKSWDEVPGRSGRLIPTPSAADAMGGHERRGGDRGGELLLKGMAKGGHLDSFGAYAPAIARWEGILGRPAPAPTEEHPRTGRPRLSPEFVEWMMGLPAGHVTALAATPGQTLSEHGVNPLLSYGAQLKALGNGVVPQQAAAALRVMLGGAS